VPPLTDSALGLSEVRLARGETLPLASDADDTLVYAIAGAGELTLDGQTVSLRARNAALVLAGEEATLAGADDTFAAIAASASPAADRHALLGSRAVVSSLDAATAERATGARSFEILLGPHNGSTRATLFAGYIPPGRAPWHYHLYDEIVWIPEGPGRLHVGETQEELGPGAAFRLRPRQLHIVENTSADRDLTIVGIFTPAGSPSAAYLTPDVAAEYRFAG
jgi:quercetin dioxygenase-like cupin family protein